MWHRAPGAGGQAGRRWQGDDRGATWPPWDQGCGTRIELGPASRRGQEAKRTHKPPHPSVFKYLDPHCCVSPPVSPRCVPGSPWRGCPGGLGIGLLSWQNTHMFFGFFLPCPGLVCSPRAPLICRGLMPGKGKQTSPPGGRQHWLPPLGGSGRAAGRWQPRFLPPPSPCLSLPVSVQSLEAGTRWARGGFGVGGRRGGRIPPLAQGIGLGGEESASPIGLGCPADPRGDPQLFPAAPGEGGGWCQPFFLLSFAPVVSLPSLCPSVLLRARD